MTTVVNSKYMPYDVYIGRSMINKNHFGNPFTHNRASRLAQQYVQTREEAIECFRQWILGTAFNDIEQERRQWILDNLHILKDKTLGCFCKPLGCHGDILKELADKL